MVQSEKIHKVLIVRLYGLGHFLMAMPLIDKARELYPKAKVELLVDDRSDAAAEFFYPQLPRYVHRDLESTEKWIADEKPDLALFTYPTGQRDIVELISRHSDRSLCHDMLGNVGHATDNLNAGTQRMEAELNLDLLRHMGLDVELKFPLVRVPEEAAIQAAEMLAALGIGGPFVAMHPGCDMGWAVKRWPIQHWAQLAGLVEKDGLSTVILGGQEEGQLAEEIIKSTSAKAIFDLTGRTPLPVLTAMLAQATAIIANDSGLMHLGAAVGAPVVAIFGPTSWYKNPPLTDRQVIVRRPVSCSPCYEAGGEWPRRSWCLEMVTPAMVKDALDHLLRQEEWSLPPIRQPFISVIVPAYNRGPRLKGLIQSLLEQTYPKELHEIIIVDNNSSDDTASIIKSYPMVRYGFTDERQSSYTARNLGISMARGEILAFTDDDAVVDPQWLAAGVEWFEHPLIGCVAGETLGAKSDSEVAQYQNRHRHMAPRPNVETASIICVATVNAFYRKAVFDKLGAFDGRMISNGDFDMTCRLLKDGRWVIRHGKKALAYHHNRETVYALFRNFFRHGYGNPGVDRTFTIPPLRTRLKRAWVLWSKITKTGLHYLVHGIKPEKGQVPISDQESWVKVLAGSNCLIFIPMINESVSETLPFFRVGIELQKLPLYPHQDYLEIALAAAARERWPGLYLYGAGKHTRRAITLPAFHSLEVLGIIDDAAKPGQMMEHIPAVPLHQALADGLQTILISTDYYEKKLLRKLRRLSAKGICVHGLYDTNAYQRYGAFLKSKLLINQKSKTALWAPPTWFYAFQHLDSLAVGLGVDSILFQGRYPEKYSDGFLDWVRMTAYRSGKMVGSIRFRYFSP